MSIFFAIISIVVSFGTTSVCFVTSSDLGSVFGLLGGRDLSFIIGIENVLSPDSGCSSVFRVAALSSRMSVAFRSVSVSVNGHKFGSKHDVNK